MFNVWLSIACFQNSSKQNCPMFESTSGAPWPSSTMALRLVDPICSDCLIDQSWKTPLGLQGEGGCGCLQFHFSVGHPLKRELCWIESDHSGWTVSHDHPEPMDPARNFRRKLANPFDVADKLSHLQGRQPKGPFLQERLVELT